MQLKIYQDNAVDELLEKTKKLLGYAGSKKFIFKAPTGSGKTIMMAEFLKQLIDDREVRSSLAFIWTAPRQLHIQSREKLENYFEGSRALKCSFFEDLDDRKIGENEILFFNWESINKDTNIYIRDNEQDFNLSKVVERTREEGREIILVIDEAHHHATSEISQKLIKDIGPKLTIEVSATPVIQDPDEVTSIQLEDVKTEGVIKKAIILNDKFENILEKGKIKTGFGEIKDSEKIVIDEALKKRKELCSAYKKEDAEINPLVLIQLPDRIGQLEDEMKNKVINILKDLHNISTEKGKLAIWLSGEHVNKENVERPDSEVEVLIFKQAIALGWDCPRAQILVLFREWHSPIFSIQTVGRIMRMPDPSHGHYTTDILNYGYVYTNLEDIEIIEDIARNYIVIHRTNRKPDYTPINLLSCHFKRHREKTRLSPRFIEIFLEEAEKHELKKKIDVKAKRLDLRIISDWKAEDVDALAGVKIIGDKVIPVSSFDLQKVFDFFARRNLSPFYPEDRSVGRVKDSIYNFFTKELEMDYGEKWEEIVQVVLSDKNIQQFIYVINMAKEVYRKKVERVETEVVLEEKWNVPASLSFGGDYVEEDRKKSVMQPFFNDRKWKPEISFIEFLEKSDNVRWWFKNGDRDATFFAVPYIDGDGEQKPFYVDFVIMFNDERIGIFDTKAGTTAVQAGPKAEGLQKYIKNEKLKGKKLWGGIAIEHRGTWLYNDKERYHYDLNDLSRWKPLEI